MDRGVDLGRVPLLDPTEVGALAGQIEAGVLAGALLAEPRLPWGCDASRPELRLLQQQGERARQRFIVANLRLVALVTRSFASEASAPSDLFQEGCLGLITAVQRFDHRRGLRFSTYALFWIRAAVGAAAGRQVGAPQIPTSRAEQLRAVRGLEAELAQQLARPPTATELASVLGRTPAWTSALLAHRAPQSLDALDWTVVESVTGVEPVEGPGPDLGWVRELLDRLPDSEREVIGLRLGFVDGRPRSRAEVARTLQQPVGRIGRIEFRALNRLREHCPQQALDQL